jgi:hypothetical protein
VSPKRYIRRDAPEWGKYDLPGWIGLLFVAVLVGFAVLGVLVSSWTGIPAEVFAPVVVLVVVGVMSWLVPRYGRPMSDDDPRIEKGPN